MWPTHSVPVGDRELRVDADSSSESPRGIQEPSRGQRGGLGHEVHELHIRHGAQGKVKQTAKIGQIVCMYFFYYYDNNNNNNKIF